MTIDDEMKTDEQKNLFKKSSFKTRMMHRNTIQIQIQIQQLFLLCPLQSDRWRITEVS